MNDYKSCILSELQLIDTKLKFVIKADNTLKSELYNFLNNGSKRIRSIVTILYLKCLNIDISDSLINLIVATELIHNASLMHDDVIDNAENRRGKETIAHKYSNKASVLLGDYIMSVAVDILNNINNKIVSDNYMLCIKLMSEAEIEQLLNIKNNVSIEKYLHIIEGKTASLFAALMASAAYLSGLDEAYAQKFGNLFGIIYQIENDTEKDSMENDEENGVQTIVNILGIEKANCLKDNYKEELRALLFGLPDNIFRKNLEDLIGSL